MAKLIPRFESITGLELLVKGAFEETLLNLLKDAKDEIEVINTWYDCMNIPIDLGIIKDFTMLDVVNGILKYDKSRISDKAVNHLEHLKNVRIEGMGEYERISKENSNG